MESEGEHEEGRRVEEYMRRSGGVESGGVHEEEWRGT